MGLCHRVRKPKEVDELAVEDTLLARVHLTPTQSGAGMLAALSRGEFDVGLGATVGVAKFADAGTDLRILAPLQTDGDQFVLRRELALRTGLPSSPRRKPSSAGPASPSRRCSG